MRTGSNLSEVLLANIRRMPVISTFFGIVIRMYYKEEHGVPHFHAEYQGQHATFDFEGEVLAGAIRSGTALKLIREWTLANRRSLESNWRAGARWFAA